VIKRIILPLKEFAELLSLQTQQFLYMYTNSKIPYTANPTVYNDIVKAMVEDVLNSRIKWAPNTDLLSGVLADKFDWYIDYPQIGREYFCRCVDGIDGRIDDIISQYVPYSTNDVWSVIYTKRDLILDNLGEDTTTKEHQYQDTIERYETVIKLMLDGNHEARELLVR